MLNRARDLWRWLTSDLDSADAERDVTAVREALTPWEHTVLFMTRAVFAFFLEFTAACLALAGGIAWLVMLVVALPPLDQVFWLVVTWPPLFWFVLRKPRALVKSAILRAVAQRAAARARANLAFGAASASSSPMAVSVDVDQAS